MALPLELPDDVLQIIKQYAKPMTDPNWRRLHRVSSLKLHLAIALSFNSSINMAFIFFIKNQTSDYIYYVEYDITGPYVRYLVSKQNIYKIDI
jgi:hypothetical protein